MSAALDHLVDLLTLQPTGEGSFRGKGSQDDGWDAIFGGHYLGQATAAAHATVEGDRRIHSLHAYFLKSGRSGEPLDYRVDLIRDGGSFSTRRVTATQGGPVLFELTASFSRPETSANVIEPTPPDDFAELAEPTSLPTYRELMTSQDPIPLPEEWALRDLGIDIRVVNAPWSPAGPSAKGGIRAWIRADGELPDAPGLHAALLAYQSDESISDNTLVPFGVTWAKPDTLIVSLDHALWFHRPFRMDEWLFVDQWPITASDNRGLATATVWNGAGQLVASFTQEALMRF